MGFPSNRLSAVMLVKVRSSAWSQREHGRVIISRVQRRFRLAGITTEVVLGVGSSALGGEELARPGAMGALVLATSRRRSEANRIAAELGARVAGVLAIAEEHVPLEIAELGRAEVARRGVDALVAAGGG